MTAVARLDGHAEPRPPIFVVLATKGRAPEVGILLSLLQRQSRRPSAIIVVATNADDLPADPALETQDSVIVLRSERAGLTIQRNVALDWIAAHAGCQGRDDAFVVFFDDDYRPHRLWLEKMEATFAASGATALCGTVLDDGAKRSSITEEDAANVIAKDAYDYAQPEAFVARNSLYGCNMAFRLAALQAIRFDEELPLYSWLEDLDVASRLKRKGLLVGAAACRGVHLGIKRGRISGIRYGYSQIANPVHLARKRSIGWHRAARYVSQALLGNSVYSLREHPIFDYRGRLKGNIIAVMDLIRGRAAPMRIMEL